MVRLRDDTVSYVTVCNKSKSYLVTLTQTTDSDIDSGRLQELGLISMHESDFSADL